MYSVCKGLNPRDALSLSVCDVYLDDPANPPCSEFPFNEYVTLRRLTDLWSEFEQANGTPWSIRHLLLTSITHIVVFAGEYPGKYQPFACPIRAEAQFQQGNMLFWGTEGAPTNYEEAFKWFQRSAEQGYVEAQVQLGDMYQFGFGVDQNYHEAVKWYRLAAEQGDVNARASLGESLGISQENATE